VNYGSVASGIDIATAAWHPLGWRPQFFAQYDPEHDYSKGVLDFPSTVLRHHYPDVPNLGDMTKFKDWPDANLDVLVGGTPCQTYSVAGLGAGLDDPRGDLMLTYVAIARRYRPRWLAWENVPGVLSNDAGRSFASLLACLTGQRINVPSGGWRNAGVVPGIDGAYGIAWRVLDTQFTRVAGFARAVPQRRRRVFVVGYLGDWRRAAAVFFEPESLRGNPAPRRRPGQEVAGALSASSGRRGGVDDPERGGLIPVVANPLTARMFKGVNTTMDEGQTMVPVSFKPSHFTRGKDGAPQDVALSLSADADKGDQDQVVLAPIPFDTTQITSATNRSNPQPGDPSHPLAAGAHTPAIAFQDRFRGDDGRGYDRPPPTSEEVCGTLETVKPWNVATAFQPRFARNDRGGPSEVAYPLTAEAGRTGKGDSAQCVIEPGIGHNSGIIWRVRRLMPVECERLQGLPDGYTDVLWRGKPAADGPRYKALGNAMSTNVMRWLGMRITMVDAL
jgi:DNA (cytosine-5)-methyltransferase 1